MKQYACPVKRILSLLTAVMTVGILFSSCGKIPRDTPYTLRVPGDASGERQWAVKLSDADVVSYSVQDAGDGQTDIVFTGLRKGKTDATVYLARAGESVQDAADVYVLTLKSDMRKNVCESDPRYGAYTARCNGSVTGAEWHIEFSDDRVVHCIEDREYPKKASNEDGMQDFKQLFTFTGRRPGATKVRIFITVPWAEDSDSTQEEFWLLVDSEYRVSLLEPTDFTSFCLTEKGMRVENDVYEAQKTQDGVRLSHYYLVSSWSDEANEYVKERMDETVVDGGEELYMYLAGLLHTCAVPDWDGFDKADTRVLDGKMFSFEAVLADGSKVRASGSNAYPCHYHEFQSGVSAAVCAAAGETE